MLWGHQLSSPTPFLLLWKQGSDRLHTPVQAGEMGLDLPLQQGSCSGTLMSACPS